MSLNLRSASPASDSQTSKIPFPSSETDIVRGAGGGGGGGGGGIIINNATTKRETITSDNRINLNELRYVNESNTYVI